MGDPFRLGNILISEWIPQTQVLGEYPQHFSVIAVPVHAAVGSDFVVNPPCNTDSLALGGLSLSAGRDQIVPKPSKRLGFAFLRHKDRRDTVMKSDLPRRFHIKDLTQAFQPFYLTAQKLRVCNSALDPLKLFCRLA